MVFSCGDGPDCPCYQAEKSRPPTKPKQLASQVVRVDAGDTVFLCMCGQSSNMPFCDGSHGAYNKANGTNITPHVLTNDTGAAKDYYCCMCGHSKRRPFCDGTHKKVKEHVSSSAP